jgi:hypothetical protein
LETADMVMSLYRDLPGIITAFETAELVRVRAARSIPY